MQLRCDLLDDCYCAIRRQRAILQEVLQLTTLDQPHADEKAPVDLSEIVNRNDVWLVESGCCPGLPPEPLLEDVVVREMRGQKLQGDHAVSAGVMGAPH